MTNVYVIWRLPSLPTCTLLSIFLFQANCHPSPLVPPTKILNSMTSLLTLFSQSAPTAQSITREPNTNIQGGVCPECAGPSFNKYLLLNEKTISLSLILVNYVSINETKNQTSFVNHILLLIGTELQSFKTHKSSSYITWQLSYALHFCVHSYSCVLKFI